MAGFLSQLFTVWGTEVAHRSLEHLVRMPWDHPVKQAGDVIGLFFEAVSNQNYDAALAQCTPGLRATLQGAGVTRDLDLLRTCLVHWKDGHANKPEVHPLHGTCRFSGTLVYTTGESGAFSFDLLRTDKGWLLNAYSVSPVPKIAPPAVIREGVAPLANGDCPPGYPVKISRSGIYHGAASRFYVKTRPVLCFASEADAKEAGYVACR